MSPTPLPGGAPTRPTRQLHDLGQRLWLDNITLPRRDEHSPCGENAPLISAEARHVEVRVIHTDEELMTARSVSRLLHLGPIRDI